MKGNQSVLFIIIILSGPDSPMAAMKDLTQAMRKQQKALEERLEACLQELRRLCLREAVRSQKSCRIVNHIRDL